MENSNNIQIRLATEQDVVGIVYVQATSWITNYSNPLAKISQDDIRDINFKPQLRQWQHILKSPSYRVWVAAEGPNIVAMIALIKDNHQAEIYQQHTLPDYQRQGLGEQLLDCAQQWVEGLPLSLHIPAYVQSGLDFYQKHGFKVDHDGEIGFIRLPNGKQIPTVVMRRVVEAHLSAVPDQTEVTRPSPPPNHQPKPAVRMVGRARLAKISGIRSSTIKYYTEVGILPFEQAEPKLARRYPRREAVKRLKLIQKLRRKGLSIDQIKERLG